MGSYRGAADPTGVYSITVTLDPADDGKVYFKHITGGGPAQDPISAFDCIDMFLVLPWPVGGGDPPPQPPPPVVPPVEPGGPPREPGGGGGGGDDDDDDEDEDCPPDSTANPVRYFDGTNRVTTVDLDVGSFISAWVPSRTWTNAFGYGGSPGSEWRLDRRPYLHFQDFTGDADQLWLTTQGTSAKRFKRVGTGWQFSPVFHTGGSQEQVTRLDLSGGGHEWEYRSANGKRFYFPYVGDGGSKCSRILAKNKEALSFTDRSDGYDVTYATAYAGATTQYREKYSINFVTGTTRPSSITQYRGNSTNPATLPAIRKVDYEYYSGSVNGVDNSLRLATISDVTVTPAQVIDKKYYRYYKRRDVTALQRDNSTNVAIATAAGHDYKVNDKVTISGVTGADAGLFNGTFTITHVDTVAGTFKYSMAAIPSSGLTQPGTKTSIANGYQGGLRYAVEGAAYARMAAETTEVELESASNDTIAPFAIMAFTYDSFGRVTSETVAGAGCSCGQGQGTTTFAYETTRVGSLYTPTGTPTSFNGHYNKTTITLPDGTVQIKYTNFNGMLVGSETREGPNGRVWREAWLRDVNGRVIAHAYPSAIIGFNEAAANLVEWTDHDSNPATPMRAALIHDTKGLIEWTVYGMATTAGTTTLGTVDGWVDSTFISRGDTTAQIKQSAQLYKSHNDQRGTADSADDRVQYYVAQEGVYKDDAGTQAITTQFAREYHVLLDPATSTYHTTSRTKMLTTSLPTLSGAQHGDEIQKTTRTVFDEQARPIWEQDPDGFLHFTAYSDTTGAVTKSIVDVNTTQTGDFSGLPSGWSTPSGGGLHLITLTSSQDAFGRPLQTVDPKGNLTRTIYKDAAHEIWTYPGVYSDGGTWKTTGPISVARQYRPAPRPTLTTQTPAGERLEYEELLTIATPVDSSNPFTGAETISSSTIQTLSRSIVNAGGQVIESNQYFAIPASYNPAAARIGTASNDSANGHYHSSQYGYDKGGRQNRVVAPTGTITRTVFDVLGRVVSVWVGTSDTNATDADPSAAGSNNMKRIVVNEYDSGGVGNGNRTGTTEYVDNSGMIRTTRFGYDWRDRLIVSKQGMESRQEDKLTLGGTATYADRYQITITGPSGRSFPLTYHHDSSDPSLVLVSNGLLAAINQLIAQEPLLEGFQAVENTSNTSAPFILLRGRPGVRFTSTATIDIDLGQPTTLTRSANPDTAESSAVNRQAHVATYDNLNRVTKTERFDGDGYWAEDKHTNGTTDGVPDGVPEYPAANMLRARSTADHDDWSRLFRASVFSVHPSNGTVGNSIITRHFLDARGNILATFAPGAPVQKTTFDGAGRAKVILTTDGAGGFTSGGNPHHASAISATSDAVLEQVEVVYDANSNVTHRISKLRFHNASATGTLSSSNSRISYGVAFYDRADRNTAAINAGTNGGTAYAAVEGLADSASSTTLTDSTLSGGASYIGYTLVITAGAGAGQRAIVTAHSTGTLTFGAMNPAPNATSHFVLVDPKSHVGTVEYDASGFISAKSDPRGIRNIANYDRLGRITQTTEAYVNGVIEVSDGEADDRITEYTYDGSSHILIMRALLPDGIDNGSDPDVQSTQYVYGTDTTSGVFSNDLLAEVRYSDKTSGSPSTSEKEAILYNRLGETTQFGDRGGNVHMYFYDVTGRLASDYAHAVGTQFKANIRELTYAYDSAGRLELATSHGSRVGGVLGSGVVSNQVKREYNGFGQLVIEYQEHNGAVNTGSPGSAKVQYAYSTPSEESNHSRLTMMTYPGGRVTHYGYNSGIDSNISRISHIAPDDGTGRATNPHLEQYSYLGLRTIVRRNRPESGTEQTFIRQTGDPTLAGDAGDEYIGFDRFGRAVDQRWIVTSTTVSLDRFRYGYDVNGNTMYKENLVNTAMSELYHQDGPQYGYDTLDRLTEFQRGTLSDASSPADGVPDTIVNQAKSQAWALDALGNWSTFNDNGTPSTRSHNRQNQITTSPLTHDLNGNITKVSAGTINYKYDAWNRMVEYGAGQTWNKYDYPFDALHRRTQEDVNSQAPISPGVGARDLYYSKRWQVIEERYHAQGSEMNGPIVDETITNVWSADYIDQLVLRDRSTTTQNWDESTNEYVATTVGDRVYVQQDANFNVTSIVGINSGSWGILERYQYDPYGKQTYFAANWTTRTGSAYAFVYLHQGGRYNQVNGLYHFRSRDYHSGWGRWMQRDPAGYVDGSNLYQYERGNPTSSLDPIGLTSVQERGECIIKLFKWLKFRSDIINNRYEFSVTEFAGTNATIQENEIWATGCRETMWTVGTAGVANIFRRVVALKNAKRLAEAMKAKERAAAAANAGIRSIDYLNRRARAEAMIRGSDRMTQSLVYLSATLLGGGLESALEGNVRDASFDGTSTVFDVAEIPSAHLISLATSALEFWKARSDIYANNSDIPSIVHKLYHSDLEVLKKEFTERLRKCFECED